MCSLRVLQPLCVRRLLSLLSLLQVASDEHSERPNESVTADVAAAATDLARLFELTGSSCGGVFLQ